MKECARFDWPGSQAGAAARRRSTTPVHSPFTTPNTQPLAGSANEPLRALLDALVGLWLVTCPGPGAWRAFLLERERGVAMRGCLLAAALVSHSLGHGHGFVFDLAAPWPSRNFWPLSLTTGRRGGAGGCLCRHSWLPAALTLADWQAALSGQPRRDTGAGQ